MGEDAVEHDGAVRTLLHPDPRRPATECRIVCETPRTLGEMGYTRMTMVPREAPAPAPRRVRRPRRNAGHLSVVPAPED
jgi:hypothetical protein